MIEEHILYFLWKYKLYKNTKLVTDSNEPVEIINQGVQNFNSGPDFINAKIKISDTLWAGTVEIHVKASDWYKHKHHTDKAYNNVILHVVSKNDKPVLNRNNKKVPALVLEIDNKLINKYKQLIKNERIVSCSEDLKLVDTFKLKMWLNNVLFDRLHKKTYLIKEKLAVNKNNWEETFYQVLARNFGFKLNAEPFERLAVSLPLKYLAKHHNNLMQIEALLFGQAGFLFDKYEHEYYNQLKKEYLHLSKKFGLKPIEKYNWRFMRSRPANFPTIRIAQFAQLIYKSTSLFSKIVHAENIHEIRVLFRVKTSEFWSLHYTFDKLSPEKEKVLGDNSIDNILINTIVPFLFLFGELTDNQMLKDKAVLYLEQLKPENNKITRLWKEAGINLSSAFFSQALIQQTNNYCKKQKCLDCGIGAEILKIVYSE